MTATTTELVAAGLQLALVVVAVITGAASKESDKGGTMFGGAGVAVLLAAAVWLLMAGPYPPRDAEGIGQVEQGADR